MDLYGLTPSELQCWGSSVKGARGIRLGTELSGIGARAGGQLSPRQSAGKATVPFISPLPRELAGGAIHETPSTWLTLFALPW